MSPYPAQIERETLIATAWSMVETEGEASLTLQKLADRFGVKAPSLYRHIHNKAALIDAVNALTEQRLFRNLYDAIEAAEGDTYERLMATALAYRSFAHAHTRPYILFFTRADDLSSPSEEELEAVLPLQALMAQLSGEAESLTALRGLLALMHGYVMLEFHQQLRRGGDLAVAYERSIRAYLDGWQGN